MNYPLISEYIEAIKAAEDSFEELTNLRPVLTDDGQPVMTSGNFAVVFKMVDTVTGKFYALKCFTKEQEGRAEAYHQIADALKDVDSPYLVSLRYLDKELFVDTEQTTETEFPVLLMDWVEGKTLDKYLRENLDDKYALEMLAYRFSQLAQWLIPQPFAHGDLKPDNILVHEDGTLVLVDYDGMYVPAMKGQKARELGSPDFRHPLRTENDFDYHIDDFPLVSILLSLTAISMFPRLLEKYGAVDRLLFSERDYTDIDNNPVIKKLYIINDVNIHILLSVFTSLCRRLFSFTIPRYEKPYMSGIVNGFMINGIDILSASSSDNKQSLSTDLILDGLMDLDDLMNANGIDYVLSGSLGLYVHGLVPPNYIPHDIDIILADNKNKHPFLTNQMILDLFVQHCGGERTDYTCYDASDLFVFFVGKNRIMINAFIDRNNVFKNFDYSIMNIKGRSIKVNNALSIFKAKYQMRRLKDYQFNTDIQNIMNGYLDEQSYYREERRELSEEEIKEWISFFFKSVDVEYSTSINLFPIIFDNIIKTLWLTPQQCSDCNVETIIYDEKHLLSFGSVPFKADAIKYSVKNKLSKKCKLEETQLSLGYLGDVSYIVDFLYKVLREMELLDSFLKNVYKLISIVNDNKIAEIESDFKFQF